MNAPAAHAALPADLQAQANILQTRATAPDAPVWVGASAGSGKTRVLVNRLLRLMLPAATRRAALPSQILCITFTRAGASEVMDRIVKILRDWAIAPADTLRDQLAALLEQTPDDIQMTAARALFAQVIETPGGMKIMTIHAFCQSVLARFPMEAGLPAGFEVMVETEAKHLMRDVRRAIITRLQAGAPADKPLKTAFDHLSTIRNADQIEKLMENMMAERGRLRDLLSRHGDIAALERAVETALGVAPGATAETAFAAFLDATPEDAMRHLASLLGQDNATNQKKAERITGFIAADRASAFDDYKSAFITQGGTIAKPNGLLAKDETLLRIYEAEGARLQNLDAALCGITTASATNALLRFSLAALAEYEDEKRRRNRLDFEDLIDRTKRLLSGDGVNWVQYKLDNGIDHILVDEAQDTNPDQWDIITALSDEFYSGAGRREDAIPTTFVVGDEKQSIFSFQRADPRVFSRQHAHLKQRTAHMQVPLQTIPMQISFRSAPSILHMVDAVFAPPEMRAGVVQEPGAAVTHYARHTGKAGHVELWPLIRKPDAEKPEPWSLPAAPARGESPVAQMADAVARKIRALLDEGRLESQDRLVQPGDIMILLGKRKPLAEAILKSLREHRIPVSGIDRMVLSRQLAVQDCLAAMAFVLQPDDDLTLASLLKSPFVNFDDDALYALAQPRGRNTLWHALRAGGGPVAAWLSALLALEGTVSSFLHKLLYGPCPADAHGGLRALLARLGEDVRDPLQELQARADAYDMNDTRGLQGFVQDTQADTGEVKRDQQESGNRVRLMTVHGAKGLEAPVVFMPDTIRMTAARNLRDAVLWPDRGDADGVPLWAQNAGTAAPACAARLEDAKIRGDEEQRRLLYVALTRAAERLYIGGMMKSKEQYVDKTNSWYYACERALKAIGVEQDGGILTLSNRQTDKPQTPKTEMAHAAAPPALPAFLFQPAPDAGTPPRPLIPSRPEADDPAVMSPLFGDISHRFQRGRLIHTLFQFLPDLPPAQRRDRAAAWLAQPAHNLKPAAREEILDAVFDVLDNPGFARLFTAEARAEVPLTGHLARPDGTHSVVSGQIDRLLVDDDGILILDYKTNRPAPRNAGDVPEAYRRQMRTYRDVLAGIWPGRPVRCALLWTDGPDLMDVTGII